MAAGLTYSPPTFLREATSQHKMFPDREEWVMISLVPGITARIELDASWGKGVSTLIISGWSRLQFRSRSRARRVRFLSAIRSNFVRSCFEGHGNGRVKRVFRRARSQNIRPSECALKVEQVWKHIVNMINKLVHELHASNLLLTTAKRRLLLNARRSLGKYPLGQLWRVLSPQRFAWPAIGHQRSSITIWHTIVQLTIQNLIPQRTSKGSVVFTTRCSSDPRAYVHNVTNDTSLNA